MAYPLFAWRNASSVGPTNRYRPSPRGMRLFRRIETKPPMAQHCPLRLVRKETTYEKSRKKKSRKVLRDTCSNRPDFVRVVAFDDPSKNFIKYPFILSLIYPLTWSQNLSSRFLSICISSMWRKDKSSFKKKKKKRSNLIVCNLSNPSDCRPRSNEKRKRGRENRRRQRDFGN